MATLQNPQNAWIGLESAGKTMSPAEFDAIVDCDELYNYELVHKVVAVHELPEDAIAAANDMLGYWLRRYEDEHVSGSTLNATLFNQHLYTPDSRFLVHRVVWAGLDHWPRPRKDPPSIVVDFVSLKRPAGLDPRIEKRQEYLALGVKEYWIIDRFRRTMTVYKGGPDAPQEQVLTEKETYKTDRLPGFELPLAHLLAAADKWKEQV